MVHVKKKKKKELQMVVITVRKIIFIPDSIRVEDPPPRGLPHQPGWPPSFPQPHGPPARVLTAC